MKNKPFTYAQVRKKVMEMIFPYPAKRKPKAHMQPGPVLNHRVVSKNNYFIKRRTMSDYGLKNKDAEDAVMKYYKQKILQNMPVPRMPMPYTGGTLSKTTLHSGISLAPKLIQGAMGIRQGAYKSTLTAEERTILLKTYKTAKVTHKHNIMSISTVKAQPRTTNPGIVDFVSDITFEGVGVKPVSYRVQGETDGFDIGEMKWSTVVPSKIKKSNVVAEAKKNYENGDSLCVNGVALPKKPVEQEGKYVPKEHFFDPEPEQIDKLMLGLRDNLPVLMIGPTGAGKTSMVRWLAYKTHHDYRRLNLNGATTVDDFVGRILINKEGTYWVDGVLLEAMKNGYWLMLDEVNAALPEILFVLHSLLDDDRMVVVAENSGDIVRPHPDFRLIAAMNPAVDYVGTKELNKAFLSRFPIVLEVDYMPQDREVEVVKKSSGLDDEATIRSMVQIANQVRKSYKEQKVYFAFSTRELINWARLSKELGIREAAKVSILSKAGKDDADFINDILNLHFE